jgi:3-deoxy-D-manno-octulosonic-acid transferase
MYSPLDFWPIMRSAFATIQPERIALVEAEVWPNLVVQAHHHRIPIALVNARLSPRSERRFLRFRSFVRPMFRLLDLICVQESEDIERWTAIIGEPRRIEYTGSIKYDTTELRSVENAKNTVNGDVLLGGSTHAGEEEALARIFLSLRSRFPSLSLFIAPRHVERARQVRKQLEALSLKVKFVSEGVSDSPTRPDCVVLDKTGELQKWYGIASVAFIGKSLLAHGGQNPVEAIVAGVPVVFGPHMENFAMLARELIAHDAAIQVNDEAGLEEAITRLLGDPGLRSRLVANAGNVLARHRGATGRTAKLFVDLRSRA